MTVIFMENIETNDLLQIVSIKNSCYSKFYTDSNAKTAFHPLYFENDISNLLKVTVTVKVFDFLLF